MHYLRATTTLALVAIALTMSTSFAQDRSKSCLNPSDYSGSASMSYSGQSMTCDDYLSITQDEDGVKVFIDYENTTSPSYKNWTGVTSCSSNSFTQDQRFKLLEEYLSVTSNLFQNPPPNAIIRIAGKCLSYIAYHDVKGMEIQ